MHKTVHDTGEDRSDDHEAVFAKAKTKGPLTLQMLSYGSP